MTFTDLLAKYPRIAIAGGPQHGKTTLSKQVTDRIVIGSDSYKSEPWSEQPLILKALTALHSAFCVEGVQVARALRKGMEVDCVVFMTKQKVKSLKPGQIGMTKGVIKVFRDWAEKNDGKVPVFFEEDLMQEKAA